MHMKSLESKKNLKVYLPLSASPTPHALCPHLKSPQTSNNNENLLSAYYGTGRFKHFGHIFYFFTLQ